MNNAAIAKTLYHVTLAERVTNILEHGLEPRLETCAFQNGFDQGAIHVYTSAERVRDALRPSGDYRKMVERVYGKSVELYVMQLLVKPSYTAALWNGNPDEIRILHPIEPKGMVVLDTNLHPVSPAKIAELASAFPGVKTQEDEIPL